MITAIVSLHDDPHRTAIARNLAVLRAESGRRVCLMSTDRAHGADWCSQRSAAGIVPWIDTRSVGGRAVRSRLEALRPLFDDILIDAGMHDAQDCRCVLACAQLAVVPVDAAAGDLDRRQRLLARVDGARSVNPGLRVLLVVVGQRAALAPGQRAAVLAQLARVPGARLADTVVHGAGAGHETALCASDRAACDPEAATEMRSLCREILAPSTRLAMPSQAHVGAAHALFG